MKTDLDFYIDEKELSYLKKETKTFVDSLKRLVKKKDADVFVGGSFAKGTLAKQDDYDVDIFVRFGKDKRDISSLLKKILKSGKIKFKEVHGSRDYFKIEKSEKLTFEIVPVRKIRNMKEANNVTDLSYFHVNYVKKKLNKNMAKEIAMAKAFCKAQGIYGAESYIHGFSGYALECLIIHYKTFEKMLKELVKVKSQLILDPEKHFKKREEVLIEINESKRHGPIILVDPTFKERNILAGLNKETFFKFQDIAKKFLKNPSEKFFVFDLVDDKKMRKKMKKGSEFVHVSLETNRQEGDIAGAKLKKYSGFLIREVEKYFDVLAKEFVYLGEKKADFYLIVKSKLEIIRKGPSLKREKHAVKFRKMNKNVFVEKGSLRSRMKVDFSAVDLVKKIIRNEDKIKEMSIVKISAHD